MRPKRALIATAIFVLLFGGFTAAAGLDDEPPTTLPSTLGTPERFTGDHGTYVSFRMDGDDLHGPFPYLEFEVLPTKTVHDREGTPRATQPLRITEAAWRYEQEPNGWHYDWSIPTVWYHDLQDDRLVNLDIILAEGTQTSQSSVDGLGLIAQDWDTSGAFEATAYLDGRGPGLTWWDPCLLHHGLMAAAVDPAGTFPLFHECTLSLPSVRDTDFIAGDAPLFPMRDDLSLRQPRYFTGIGQDGELTVLATVGQQAAERPIRVWIDPATPYPVQVAVADPGQPGAWDLLVLRDLERGSGLPSAPAPKAPIRVDLPLATTALYGLNEAGLEHPYLPSEALQDAMQHAELADWFERNPDARLTQLSGGRSHFTTANDHVTWRFQFASPDGHASFWVERDMDPVGQAVAGVPGRDQVMAPPTFFEQVDDTPDNDPNLTAPLRGAPRAAELLRLFEAYAGPVDGHPSWSLELTCLLRTANGCREAGWEIGVGRSELRLEPEVREDPSVATAGSILEHGLYLDPLDGRPVMMLRIDFEQTSSTTPVQGAPDPQPPEPSQTAADVHWDLPPGRVLAGTGFVAAITALAYLFWPALKTASMGLFSRIHGEQSLNHPMRARLAQTIAAEPGVHFQDLVRATGAGRGATEHHLRKLVETGQVLRHDAGGYVCFFPKRTDRHVMAAAPALRSETARQALRLIIEQPGIHGAALAEALGVNRGTLSHHVQRLAKAGVMTSIKEGRAVAYHATDVGRKVAASGMAA